MAETTPWTTTEVAVNELSDRRWRGGEKMFQTQMPKTSGLQYWELRSLWVGESSLSPSMIQSSSLSLSTNMYLSLYIYIYQTHIRQCRNPCQSSR